MSLVGNDVVDLDDVHNAGAHLRERFVARVCHPSELGWVERASDREEAFWRLFAVKEAGYKVVSKLRVPPGFAFRRFVVAPDLTSVQFENIVVSVRVKLVWRCVHAVAWLGDPPRGEGVVSLSPNENSSSAARRALLSYLGGEAGLEVVRDEIEGSWDGYGPPRVLRGGVQLPIDVSLSHDGRYAAFAAS